MPCWSDAPCTITISLEDVRVRPGEPSAQKLTAPRGADWQMPTCRHLQYRHVRCNRADLDSCIVDRNAAQNSRLQTYRRPFQWSVSRRTIVEIRAQGANLRARSSSSSAVSSRAAPPDCPQWLSGRRHPRRVRRRRQSCVPGQARRHSGIGASARRRPCGC